MMVKPVIYVDKVHLTYIIFMQFYLAKYIVVEFTTSYAIRAFHH